MKEKVTRKFLQGFMQLHILYHAKTASFYGTWMIDELKSHGYDISPGTLYPVLHSMEKNGLLSKETINVEGKLRIYYKITDFGTEILYEVRDKAIELFREMEEIL